MKLTSKEYRAFKIVQLITMLICFPIMESFGPSALGWSSYESWTAAVIISVFMQHFTEYIMKSHLEFLELTAEEKETSQN